MSQRDELRVQIGMAPVLNEAQIVVYPVETVGALQVIWTARTVLRLAPGQTRVLYAPFRDDNGARCAAVEVADLVATTDYTVNDRADGSGFDYTASPHFAISLAVEATRAQITLSNTAIGPLYVTHLQVRGKPIRTYDPITVVQADGDSQARYERRARVLDLALQSDPVFAQAYAEYLVGRFAEPALAAEAVTIADRDVIGGVNVFSVELMDRVAVNDAHAGLDALQHWVRAVDYELGAESFRVTLHLERADDRRYWRLGAAGYSELGATTRLGF